MIKLNTHLGIMEKMRLRVLYERAFPKSEKKPFSLINKMAKEGKSKIFAIENSGRFVGLVIMLEYKDIALVDYLAIVPKMRKMGYGGMAVKAIRDIYNGWRIILEIEDPDNKTVPDADTRVKRLAFYERCGMKRSDFKVKLFGVDMQIMSFEEGMTFKDYYEIFESYFPGYAKDMVKLLSEEECQSEKSVL